MWTKKWVYVSIGCLKQNVYNANFEYESINFEEWYVVQTKLIEQVLLANNMTVLKWRRDVL